MGRPSVMTVDKIQMAIKLRERGFSLNEIADAIGVDRSTLFLKNNEWDKLREQLNLIKAKKEIEEIGKIKKALVHRALGQTIKEKKEIFDSEGNLQGYTITKKQIQGDFKAQQFYLINKDPQNWKATPEENAKEKTDNTIIIKVVE